MSKWSTGKYRSRKSGVVYDYKSSWEAIYMDKLDSNPQISEWVYEPVFVCYLHEAKVKKYIPDFLVTLKSGRKILVEIKPERMRNISSNVAKRNAVLQKCDEEKWEYYEWSPGEQI